MGFRGPKTIESGVFLSPALGTDGPYELIADSSYPDGMAVRCVDSGSLHPTTQLAVPTLQELSDQYRAFVREISAWLVANGPHNPARRRLAVQEIRRLTGEDYVSDDLDDDVLWVMENDLGQRLPLLGRHLDGNRRGGLLQLAAELGAAGGLSESDAQFVELLGSGLNVDASIVMHTVVSALDQAKHSAA